MHSGHLGETRRRGRGHARLLTRCRSHVPARLLHRGVGDAEVGGGGTQHETGAAGSAQTQRVQSPVRSSVTSADDEHLVARRAIGGAPRGREDRVGVVAVGDHGAFLTSDTARRTAPPRTCCAGRRPRCPVPSSPMPAGTDRRPRHAGRRRHRRHPDAVRARGSGSGASRTPSPSRRSDARGSWRSCTVREASRFATQSRGNGTREQPLVPERVDRFVRTRASRSTSTAQRAATSATTLSARAAGPHDCADSIPVPLARAILMPLRVRRVRPEWNPHSRTCSCAEARRENRCRTNPPAPA